MTRIDWARILRHPDPYQTVALPLPTMVSPAVLPPRPEWDVPSKPKIESPYLTVDEAAEYCRVAVKTIYNHRHEIPRQPGVGKLLFTRDALDTWLAGRKKRR